MNFLLLGKPNVGKSSIYNILTGNKSNIIHNVEGTTRDWHNSDIINISNCQVYDTPGILLKKIHGKLECKPKISLILKQSDMKNGASTPIVLPVIIKKNQTT